MSVREIGNISSYKVRITELEELLSDREQDLKFEYARAEAAEKLVKELKEALKQNIAHCKKCCRDNSILNKLPNTEMSNPVVVEGAETK